MGKYLSQIKKNALFGLTDTCILTIVGQSGEKWGIVGVLKMYRGVAQLNLDSKGRLAIPAKHRESLAVQCKGLLVVTADPSQCLLIYPQPEWEPIQEKLMKLSSFNPQTRSLQRLLVGYAEDAEIDAAGRILISQPLRDFAGLNKRVLLVGQGNKFELWDEESWISQREGVPLFSGGQMPPELEGFSL